MDVNITVNGEDMVLAAPLSIAELLVRLKRDTRRVAVELNGELVPRESQAERSLQSGDQIEIVGFVGGG